MGLKFFPEVGRQSKDYLQYQPATLGGNQPLWTVISPDTAAANWGMGFNDNSVVLGTRNNLMSWGYNTIDGQATREDTSEPNIVFTIESNFNTGTENLMELHVGQGEFADGTAFRMLSMTAERTTHNQIMNIQTDKVNYLRRTDGDQCLQLNGHTISVGNSTNATTLQFEKNNAAALTQINAAASTYRNLILLNSSNQVSIGSSGDTTLLGSHLYFPAAETSDIGQSAANRPNNVYAKGIVTAGTFTWTAGTQSSVLFVGAAGVVSQDNANFTFDDATNILVVNGKVGVNVTPDTATLALRLSSTATSWSGGTTFAFQSLATLTPTSLQTQQFISLYGAIDLGGTAQCSDVRGMQGFINCSNTNTLTVAEGSVGSVQASSAATVNELRALVARMNHASSATVTSMYGLYVAPLVHGGAGALTNTVGVYIGDITAGTQTNTPYGVLQDDANCQSLFKGTLGVGPFAPGLTNYQFFVATGTTTVIPCVLFGIASQTANMFQCRDSSHNVLFRIDKDGGFVGNEFGLDVDCRIEGDTEVNLFYTDASVDFVGIGTSAPGMRLEVEETKTITGAVTDGFAGSIALDPGYTAATAQTVTRHNYIDVQNVSTAGAGPAAVTNAAVLRFDAAAGTHKALAGTGGGVAVTIGDGPSGSTAGNPQGWMRVNINGTLRYMPFW